MNIITVPNLLDYYEGGNDMPCDALEYLCNLSSEFSTGIPTSASIQTEYIRARVIRSRNKAFILPFLRIYYSVTYNSLILYLQHCLGLL